MRIPRPSRSAEFARAQMSPSWPPALRPAWRGLVGWPARTPVGHGPTGSSDRQPEPAVRVQGRSTAAGPGGGAALMGGSVAPPPTFSPLEPAATRTTNFRELRDRQVDAGDSPRPTVLSGPDRESVLSRVVTGGSIPDIVTILVVTLAVVGLAQRRALGALRPAATANDPPPANRGRVVLLPHPRTELSNTPANNRRTTRGTGMNQDDFPRHRPAQNNDTNGSITTSSQWHDAELAMRVARHSFESWRVAGHEDTPSLAIMHAHRTHTALHEASRAISTLIETFRVEAATLRTRPVPSADIPTQRR